jgi:23S rRNA A2030 N6-methylase RlmJ
VNYNHEFYAGNFADVFKHAVLCRVLHYLRGKPAAFRVIDTHAGAGVYDLTGEKSTRGGEWQAGIGKLMAAQTLEQWRSSAPERTRSAPCLSWVTGPCARLVAPAGPAARL